MRQQMVERRQVKQTVDDPQLGHTSEPRGTRTRALVRDLAKVKEIE